MPAHDADLPRRDLVVRRDYRNQPAIRLIHFSLLAQGGEKMIRGLLRERFLLRARDYPDFYVHEDIIISNPNPRMQKMQVLGLESPAREIRVGGAPADDNKSASVGFVCDGSYIYDAS